MRSQRWSWGIGMVALALASCGSEGTEDPGSIRVTWRFGGKTCADLGVVTVRASVRDSKGKDALEPTPTFPCSDGTVGVVIEDVPPGTYTLILEGMTAEGHPYYQGTRTGVRVESGKETTVSPTINLELKKSEVLLNWEFPSGTGFCNGNGVVQVEVSAFDSTSSTVYADVHPCILPAETYPDNGVLISGLRGNEELTFLLYGLNKSAQRTHHGEKKVTTVPGERSAVNVVLESCPGPDQCP